MHHRTEGMAWRVKVLGAGVETLEFFRRYIEVEYGKGVVLVMTPDGREHEVTAPLATTVIQWLEPSDELAAEGGDWTTGDDEGYEYDDEDADPEEDGYGPLQEEEDPSRYL